MDKPTQILITNNRRVPLPSKSFSPMVRHGSGVDLLRRSYGPLVARASTSHRRITFIILFYLTFGLTQMQASSLPPPPSRDALTHYFLRFPACWKEEIVKLTNDARQLPERAFSIKVVIHPKVS